jgi:hypothetical protein
MTARLSYLSPKVRELLQNVRVLTDPRAQLQDRPRRRQLDPQVFGVQ